MKLLNFLNECLGKNFGFQKTLVQEIPQTWRKLTSLKEDLSEIFGLVLDAKLLKNLATLKRFVLARTCFYFLEENSICFFVTELIYKLLIRHP